MIISSLDVMTIFLGGVLKNFIKKSTLYLEISIREAMNITSNKKSIILFYPLLASKISFLRSWQSPFNC